MNFLSNIGITELIVILLLALLVVGPERLPEMGRQLAKILKDIRRAYENLTSDLGPELMSIQETTKELRQSVDAVRSIPQDVVKSVVQAADLEDTVEELKDVTGSLEQMSQTISTAGKVVKDPIGAAVNTARDALIPEKADEAAVSTAIVAAAEEVAAEAAAAGAAAAGAAEDEVTADEAAAAEAAVAELAEAEQTAAEASAAEAAVDEGAEAEQAAAETPLSEDKAEGQTHE